MIYVYMVRISNVELGIVDGENDRICNILLVYFQMQPENEALFPEFQLVFPHAVPRICEDASQDSTPRDA
jgi:hypothetical protein